MDEEPTKTDRDFLKRITPDYDNLRGINKILLEEEHGVGGSSDRRYFTRPLTLLGMASMAVVTYKLSKAGFFHQPADMSKYTLGVLLGAVYGYALGFSIGTLYHECTASDGEVRVGLRRIKNYINSNSK